MDVNFELYKIFYVVANNKSISKGAEKLLISQPAVTQAIKNLEGQLRTTLFIRTKKGIVLTEEGREFYSFIKEGMNYFINGTNKLQELRNLESGTLKIGASTSITENYLMPFINKFHELYPKIEIKIVNQLTDVLLQELRNGNIDIVVGSESTKKNSDLKFHKISKIDYIFISNTKTELSINEILDSKLIIQTPPSVTRTIFDNFIKENNLSYNLYIEVVSHRLVTEFVKNGMGIGLAVKQFINNDLKDKKLFQIKTDLILPTRNIGYTVVNSYIPSYAVKKFIEILKEKN